MKANRICDNCRHFNRKNNAQLDNGFCLYSAENLYPLRDATHCPVFTPRKNKYSSKKPFPESCRNCIFLRVDSIIKKGHENSSHKYSFWFYPVSSFYCIFHQQPINFLSTTICPEYQKVPVIISLINRHTNFIKQGKCSMLVIKMNAKKE